MRVSSKENSSGRGYASIMGPLYPGSQRAARWSVSVGPVCVMFVLVNLPFFVSVVARKTSFQFYIVFDVMFFVDCAVYLYRGSSLSCGLLGGECKMSLVLCVEF